MVQKSRVFSARNNIFLVWEQIVLVGWKSQEYGVRLALELNYEQRKVGQLSQGIVNAL